MIVKAKNKELETMVFNYGPGVDPNEGTFLIDNKYIIFAKLLSESIVIELNEEGQPIDACARFSTEHLTYNGKTAFEYLIQIPHITNEEREYLQNKLKTYDMTRLPSHLNVKPKTNLMIDVWKNFTIAELENKITMCRRNDIFIVSYGNRPTAVLKFDENEKIIDGYICGSENRVYNGKYVADWILDLDHITEEEREHILYVKNNFRK